MTNTAKDSCVCLGKCGAVPHHVVDGYLRCPKCGAGAVWLGNDAAQRLIDEPGMIPALRRKYGRRR